MGSIFSSTSDAPVTHPVETESESAPVSSGYLLVDEDPPIQSVKEAADVVVPPPITCWAPPPPVMDPVYVSPGGITVYSFSLYPEGPPPCRSCTLGAFKFIDEPHTYTSSCERGPPVQPVIDSHRGVCPRCGDTLTCLNLSYEGYWLHRRTRN